MNVANSIKVNLACGGTFIQGENWINLDFSPTCDAVRKADLLAPLPFATGSVAIVYSSHFLEHIPRKHVPTFLLECFRILKPGGMIRLVMPDLEEMCREYLLRREREEHEKADFVVLEMVDQCVRLRSGGELGQLYRVYAADPERNADMIGYVKIRTGEDLKPVSTVLTDVMGKQTTQTGFPTMENLNLLKKVRFFTDRLWRRIMNFYFDLLISRLPPTFREQNISFAGVGERHHWLWDFHQLKRVLLTAGFVNIERTEFNKSRVEENVFYMLDADNVGLPRKGAESMYVEANKHVKAVGP